MTEKWEWVPDLCATLLMNAVVIATLGVFWQDEQSGKAGVRLVHESNAID